ncbi:MAG: hypothetical protein GY733_18720 [bacterium]|nr:hypothetical protein [bacterium]
MNRRRLATTLLLFVLGTTSWGCATSNPRVAMVVGNSRYQHTTPLANPANDARAMSERLSELGWQVTTAIDVPADGLETATALFEREIQNAEQVIFYYAGHGMQIDGENYIVPIEFDPEQAQLQRDLISVSDTIDRFKPARGQLVVLLDACPDNPLAFEYETASRARSRGLQLPEGNPTPLRLDFGTGLAELAASAGSFIAYSTAPGHIALDGMGKQSPFTRALLEHMGLRDRDVAAVLVLVRNQVMLDTGGTQVPWDHSSLTESFSINPAGSPDEPSH